MTIKNIIIKYILKKYRDKIWEASGRIALRFYDKDTGEYDDLQDKLNYWITCEIKDI